MKKNITADSKGVGDLNLSSYNTTLQLRTTTIRRKDGMVQKYCGLQLPESGKAKSVVPTRPQTIPAAHNTTLQLRTTAIRRKDGMVQKYCDLQLLESGKAISVVPTRPQTIPAAHKSSGACVSYEKLEYPLRRCRFCSATTVGGSTYDSFRQACYARGMLHEDTEWTDAIQEAQVWATGNQIRELFVTILLFCDVTSPSKLWSNNREALSEDILYQKRKQFRFPNLSLTEHQIKNYCLLHIEDILARNGKALADFPDLPTPDKKLLTDMDNKLIQEEMSYSTTEMERLHDTLFRDLNQEQLIIYNKVIQSVHNQSGKFYFVYGAGGTGKTFLYKTIMARLRSERKIVLAVASSGIASLLLPGGLTAHSRFIIPIDLLEDSTCGITHNSHLAKLLHEVQLIIWDEAPMTQRFAFEALNRTLQDIQGIRKEENKRKLFGGITVLLGGDFRQILSVITKGKRQEIVQACISNSPLWQSCEVLTLSQSMRVNEHLSDGTIDTDRHIFNKWILEVGDGKAKAVAIPDEDEPTWINIPPEFIIAPGKDPVEAIVKEVFTDLGPNNKNATYLQERAILTPLNEDADKINEHMFDMLPGDAQTYKSSDEICMASTDTAEQEHMYPVEFLNKLNFPGMPPHTLKLKEGLPVMLMRNVNPTQGLCNGTRLIIMHLGAWVIEAEILTGTNMGRNVVIPRITLSSTKTKWPFVMKRRQFPIKQCFAMTINKSQGQSLNHVGLYLPKPVFCHGQLYVGISRVTDPKGIKILIVPGASQPKTKTKNIVFQEAFNNLKSHVHFWEHTNQWLKIWHASLLKGHESTSYPVAGEHGRLTTFYFMLLH